VSESPYGGDINQCIVYEECFANNSWLTADRNKQEFVIISWYGHIVNFLNSLSPSFSCVAMNISTCRSIRVAPINTTTGIGGTGTDYPSGVSDFTSGYRVVQSLVFCVMLCGTLSFFHSDILLSVPPPIYYFRLLLWYLPTFLKRVVSHIRYTNTYYTHILFNELSKYMSYLNSK
jgi:hypothetical protein